MTPNTTPAQAVNLEILALCNAFTRGALAGEIETTIGNIFHGAYKSARFAGYLDGSRSFKMFVSGYMSVMPYGVTHDKLMRVTSVD